MEHQLQAFHNKLAPHLLPGMNLDLPPGVSNVYYYDTIGNVSTSKLRAAPSVPKGQPIRQYSALDLRPRYPIMGGWNYSFTLGWDTPLADSVGWDAKSGKYVAELPIMTIFPGAVMYVAEISVILPEGATYVICHFEVILKTHQPSETLNSSLHILQSKLRFRITSLILIPLEGRN